MLKRLTGILSVAGLVGILAGQPSAGQDREHSRNRWENDRKKEYAQEQARAEEIAAVASGLFALPKKNYGTMPEMQVSHLFYAGNARSGPTLEFDFKYAVKFQNPYERGSCWLCVTGERHNDNCHWKRTGDLELTGIRYSSPNIGHIHLEPKEVTRKNLAALVEEENLTAPGDASEVFRATEHAAAFVSDLFPANTKLTYFSGRTGIARLKERTTGMTLQDDKKRHFIFIFAENQKSGDGKWSASLREVLLQKGSYLYFIPPPEAERSIKGDAITRENVEKELKTFFGQ